jgi:hypothetical protein
MSQPGSLAEKRQGVTMSDGPRRRMSNWILALLIVGIGLVVLFLGFVTLVYIECNNETGFSCGG